MGGRNEPLDARTTALVELPRYPRRHRPLLVEVDSFREALRYAKVHDSTSYENKATKWGKDSSSVATVHMTYELLLCIEAHAPGSVGATVASKFFHAEPWKLPKMTKIVSRAPVKSEILNYDEIASEMNSGASSAAMLRRGLNCSHLAALVYSETPAREYTNKDLDMIFVEHSEEVPH